MASAGLRLGWGVHKVRVLATRTGWGSTAADEGSVRPSCPGTRAQKSVTRGPGAGAGAPGPPRHPRKQNLNFVILIDLSLKMYRCTPRILFLPRCGINNVNDVFAVRTMYSKKYIFEKSRRKKGGGKRADLRARVRLDTSRAQTDARMPRCALECRNRMDGLGPRRPRCREI